MNEDVSPHSIDYRERVVVFLAFLTSDVCTDACRRFVAPEEVAAALSRRWFDEIYVPGESYLYGLKGDRSEEALRRFEACFTDDERAALERFHGFFELRLDMVSNSARGRAFFPDNDSWRNIIRDAAYLLNDLEPDPDRIRAMLEGFVREALREEDGAALLDALRHPKRLGRGTG